MGLIVSDEAAAVLGVYTDLVFKKGLEIARITIEIPIKDSGDFIEKFGTPDATAVVPVILARQPQNAALAQRSAPITSPQDTGEGKDTPRRTRTRGQRCAFVCSIPAFIEWIGGETEAEAEHILKEKLGIKSRTELNTNDIAWRHWERIEASYEMGEVYLP